jgi:hypothetical protein
MKTRKITKNELLKLIRESKQDRFEVIEPVTKESLSNLSSRVTQLLRTQPFLEFVVYPDR